MSKEVQSYEHPHEIEGVAWDVDGTLADTIPAIVGTHHALRRELDLPTLSDDAIKAWIGTKPEVIFSQLYGEGSHAELHPRFRDLVLKHQHLVKEIPYALETVRTLQEAGITNTLLTSRSVYLAETLKASGLHLDDFVYRIDGNTPGPGKPDTIVMEETAQAVGIPVERIAVAGDAVTDMMPARGVAAFAIGVSLEPNKRHPVERSHITVYSLRDIPKVIAASNEVFRRRRT